jgi:hypothetical protein
MTTFDITAWESSPHHVGVRAVPARDLCVRKELEVADMPYELLVKILIKLMLIDKKAPRSASVAMIWKTSAADALASFVGGDHLWFSPPYEPLVPYLTMKEILHVQRFVRCVRARVVLGWHAF